MQLDVKNKIKMCKKWEKEVALFTRNRALRIFTEKTGLHIIGLRVREAEKPRKKDWFDLEETRE